MRKLPVLLVVVLGLGACSDQGPEIPRFEGSWAGFLTEAGMNIQMFVVEDRQVITGAGKFTGGPTGPVAFTVTGVHIHPELVFIIRAAGFADVNFTGSFNGPDSVTGRLDGAGFSNTSAAMGRQ